MKEMLLWWVRFVLVMTAFCFVSVTHAVVTTEITPNATQHVDSVLVSDGFARISATHPDGVYVYSCTTEDCSTFTSQKIYNSTTVDPAFIELGSDELVRVVFYDYGSNEMHQVICLDAACATNTSTVIANAASAGIENIAMLPDNTLAVLVYKTGVNAQLDLHLLHCDDIDCSSSTLQPVFTSQDGWDNYYIGDAADIEVASDGTIHIVYAKNERNQMYHVTCVDVSCSSLSTTLVKDEIPPREDQDRGYLDLELTRSGDLPRIAYYQYLDCEDDDFYCMVPHIYMLFCEDVACMTTIDKNIENNWYTGDTVSMELNSQDYPVLVYGHFWNNSFGDANGLRLTECMDELCDSLQRSFLVNPREIATVDEAAVRWTSLTLSLNDNIIAPHIYNKDESAPWPGELTIRTAYTQRSEDIYPKKEELFLQATDRGGAYGLTGNIGDGIQVAKGVDGLPRIAYYDYWMDTVRYVRCYNAQCTDRFQTVIDGTGDSVNYDAPSLGGYLDIKVGTDGLPRIAYTAGGDGDRLYIATCTTQECVKPTIQLLEDDAINYKYRAVDMELDQNNIPHLVFSRILTPTVYPFTMREYVGSCSDALCTSFSSTQVDTGMVISGSTGTAFSPTNEFMFLNYDFTTGLELWRCVNADCSSRVETSIAGAFAGNWDYRASEIKFGTDNLPRIAYVDTTFFQVHFLRCNDLDCTTFSDEILPFRTDVDFVQMELNDQNYARIVASTYPAPNFMAGLEYVSCDNEDCTVNEHQIIYDGSESAVEYSFRPDIMLSDQDVPFIVNANPSLTTASANLMYPEAITCKDYRCRTESGPTIPTDLFANNTDAQTGRTNPNDLISKDVVFSSIFKVLDATDLASAFRLQVATDNTFRDIVYDSGKSPLTTNTAMDGRIEDITIPGTAINYATTYHWRIKLWDDNDVQGLYSNVHTAANTFFVSSPGLPTFANFAPATVIASHTPLTFDITRSSPVVNLDDLKLDIDGTVVWEDSTCTVGYTCTFTPIANGYEAEITPVAPWVNGDYILNGEYRISNGDPYQSLASENFTVAIAGVSYPTVNNFAPAMITAANTPVTFDITRATLGVQLSNLTLEINNAVVWQNNACDLQYTCTFTPIADGYDVQITPLLTWTNGNYILDVDYRLSNADPYQTIDSENFVVNRTVIVPGGAGGSGGGGYISAYALPENNIEVGESQVLNLPITEEAEAVVRRIFPSRDIPIAPSLRLLERVFAANIAGENLPRGEGAVGQSLCTELTDKLSELPSDPTDSDYRRLLREYGLVLGLGSSNNQHMLISRSEILRLVLQSDCGSFTIPPVATKPFPDVETSHKDAIYIQIAKIQTIVSGYLHDGTYKPDNQISRAEALKVILEVVLGRMGHTLKGLGQTAISDVANDAWYYRYIDYAAERGIIGTDAFRPNDKATREDVAGFLLRTLEVAGK